MANAKPVNMTPEKPKQVVKGPEKDKNTVLKVSAKVSEETKDVDGIESDVAMLANGTRLTVRRGADPRFLGRTGRR